MPRPAAYPRDPIHYPAKGRDGAACRVNAAGKKWTWREDEVTCPGCKAYLDTRWPPERPTRRKPGPRPTTTRGRTPDASNT